MVKMTTNIWSASAQREAAGRADTGPRSGPDLRRGDEERWLSDTDGSPVAKLLRHSRAWSRERVPVGRNVRRVLWLALPVQLVWAGGLALLMSAAVSCSAPVCTIATLGGRVGPLFVCATISLALLGGLVLTTRGLSSTDCREAASLTFAVATGSIALIGVAAVLCVVAIVLITFAVLFGTMTVTP